MQTDDLLAQRVVEKVVVHRVHLIFHLNSWLNRLAFTPEKESALKVMENIDRSFYLTNERRGRVLK